MGRIDSAFSSVSAALTPGACGDDEPCAPPGGVRASLGGPVDRAVGAGARPGRIGLCRGGGDDGRGADRGARRPPRPGSSPYLDEAIGIELGALEGATPEQRRDGRRKALDRLPEQPREGAGGAEELLLVLAGGPDALYDKAVPAVLAKCLRCGRPAPGGTRPTSSRSTSLIDVGEPLHVEARLPGACAARAGRARPARRRSRSTGKHQGGLAGGQADRRPVALAAARVPVVVGAEADDAVAPHHRGGPVTPLISAHASIASARRFGSATASRNSSALTMVGGVFGSPMVHLQYDAFGQTVGVGRDQGADAAAQPGDLGPDGDDVLASP